MTGSVPATRQLRCTSTAIEVTFLLPMVLATAPMLAGLVITATGAFTRSKIVPRLTAKLSWRWPTNTLAGMLQPGMLTVWMCLAA